MKEPFAMVPCWAIKNKRLSGNDWQIYLALRMFAGDKLEAWPKREQLAEATGLPDRVISRCTAKLVSLGLIEKAGNGGRSKPTFYRLIEPHKTLTELSPFSAKNPDKTVPKTLTNLSGALKRTIKDHNTGFAAFYSIYPKKRSKATAERAWKRINPSEQLAATILDAVEKAKTSEQWTRDNGRFIPHPATWLNARAWEDEIEQTNRRPTKVVL